MIQANRFSVIWLFAHDIWTINYFNSILAIYGCSKLQLRTIVSSNSSMYQIIYGRGRSGLSTISSPVYILLNFVFSPGLVITILTIIYTRLFVRISTVFLCTACLQFVMCGSNLPSPFSYYVLLIFSPPLSDAKCSSFLFAFALKFRFFSHAQSKHPSVDPSFCFLKSLVNLWAD